MKRIYGFRHYSRFGRAAIPPLSCVALMLLLLTAWNSDDAPPTTSAPASSTSRPASVKPLAGAQVGKDVQILRPTLRPPKAPEIDAIRARKLEAARNEAEAAKHKSAAAEAVAAAKQPKPDGKNGNGTPPPEEVDDAELERLRQMAIASTQKASQPSTSTMEAVVPRTQPAGDEGAIESPRPRVQTPEHRTPVRVVGATSKPGDEKAATPPSDAAAEEAKTAEGAPPAASEPTLAELLRDQALTLPPERQTYRFDYVETEWKDVLDDFARRAGLSIVGDIGSLTGTLSYRSPREFTFKEALYQLNELLLARIDKVLVRQEELQLRVKRLPDWIRGIPRERMYGSYPEFLAANLEDHDTAQVYYDPPPSKWTAAQIVDQFRPMFSDVFDVSAEGTRIKLAGMSRDIRYFDEVISFVTSQNDPDAPIRVWASFPLRNHRATDMRNLLQGLFPAQAPQQRPGGQSPTVIDKAAIEAGKIDFIPNDANHTLLVQAVPSKLGEIRRVIDELERQPKLPEVEFKFYTPKHRTPDELIEGVQALADAKAASASGAPRPTPAPPGRGRRGGPPPAPAGGTTPEEELKQFDLSVVPGRADILISGRAQGIAEAESLIAIVDVPSPQRERQTIVLRYRTTGEVVALVTQIFDTTVGTRGGGMMPQQPQRGRPPVPQPTPAAEMPVTIIEDQATNSLIVDGRPAEMAPVLEFIAQLDQPLDDVTEHFYRPTSLKPSELATMLTRIEAAGGGVTGRKAPAAAGGPKG
ncbi:MAG: hypothetical protein HUU22_18835, partial [Phycisphaerae bacterium]|nr:hypothetical protein [Phycisphaerae bacterium]